MLKLKQFWIIFFVFFLFCTFAYSKNYPERIISLGPAVTEELYLLGLEDRIIANTVYCKSPKGKKEKIGTVIKVDLEKIVELKPDLVIATSLTDRQQLQAMKNLKINVIEIPLAKNFQEICKNFLQLARITGKDKEAAEIIKQAEKRIAIIRKKTKALPERRVIVQIGARPLFVATKEYFVNDFIGFAGGINLTSDLKSGLYSREEVLKQNPDIIIITTMGIVGEAEKEIWQRYKSLNAVKNDRIYIIDSDKLCAPTPANFADTLTEIVKILHPQIE